MHSIFSRISMLLGAVLASVYGVLMKAHARISINVDCGPMLVTQDEVARAGLATCYGRESVE